MRSIWYSGISREKNVRIPGIIAALTDFSGINDSCRMRDEVSTFNLFAFFKLQGNRRSRCFVIRSGSFPDLRSPVPESPGIEIQTVHSKFKTSKIPRDSECRRFAWEWKSSLLYNIKPKCSISLTISRFILFVKIFRWLSAVSYFFWDKDGFTLIYIYNHTV